MKKENTSPESFVDEKVYNVVNFFPLQGSRQTIGPASHGMYLHTMYWRLALRFCDYVFGPDLRVRLCGFCFVFASVMIWPLKLVHPAACHLCGAACVVFLTNRSIVRPWGSILPADYLWMAANSIGKRQELRLQKHGWCRTACIFAQDYEVC